MKGLPAATTSGIKLLADGVVIYQKNNLVDNSHILQNDLNKFTEWEAEYGKYHPPREVCGV